MIAAARRTNGGGYTLIEMLVVLAILGILAAASWPLAELNGQRVREQQLDRALWQIRGALDQYKHLVDLGEIKAPTESGYPPDLAALANGITGLKSGTTIFLLRRVPRDPFADGALPADQTWGLRAYNSPGDKPEAGKDVYDVYSQSSGTGLNGVPLRQW
ncbi:type II secretion system protein [Amantichitinum ursilacus]|uniref:Type II secretion system protein G n=1 Tax=Amantichitinum ursilacus TaxID=857265 RepID=A0A0N0GR50_9NEIS|nr:type II secretion system protein [Amantichitinum ursilacus]KPC55341.1 hypothetical protein WG78_01750 [Amantichitinum ursilacus]